MSRRVGSPPPELDGFSFLESIGSGGFADVFLFRRHRPNRVVAVKVLRSEHLSPEAIAQFEREADVMAGVSTHPHIVSVYTSGISIDGRPYIEMEFYPRPSFDRRMREGTMSVPDVLRIGIQIASAAHHAHESGIVHRDIKPANILTSEFDKPALTDFGIARVVAESTATSATGLTIEFAPPELIRDPDSSPGVAGDVYSLAATIYALLAGRPPLWRPAESNTDRDLIARALRDIPPPTGRPDTGSLEYLLHMALSRNPDHRPRSALGFARALQDIEHELHLPLTPIEARAAGPYRSPADRVGADAGRDPTEFEGRVPSEGRVASVDTAEAGAGSLGAGADVEGEAGDARTREYVEIEAAPRPEEPTNPDAFPTPLEADSPAPSPATPDDQLDPRKPTSAIAEIPGLVGTRRHRPGSPPASAGPTEIPGPARGRLILPDGREHRLTRSVLIGRAPSLSGDGSGDSHELLLLDDPGPGVSRTHFEIRLDGARVDVVDRGSRNGTFLAVPGWPVIRLAPGVPHPVPSGTTILFGRGLKIRYLTGEDE